MEFVVFGMVLCIGVVSSLALISYLRRVPIETYDQDKDAYLLIKEYINIVDSEQDLSILMEEREVLQGKMRDYLMKIKIRAHTKNEGKVIRFSDYLGG
ncbi:hypothetical protein [Paraglaciecola sp.]|uniref:hypothetical protein n=1 Tax=Paraglaciecola sp. TaxID=1920173 RepID=UPI003EF25CB9